MSNNKHTTKQKVLDISINLFAKYGYKEVSMRQIASEVGVKASSLYKHYKSKEDILESIFCVFEEKLRQTEADIPHYSSPLEYFDMAYMQFKQVMWDPTVLKIARIITREQVHSTKAKQFFMDEMIKRPVQATKYILDGMKTQGIIGDVDIQVISEEYCGYIVYLFFEQNILRAKPNQEYIDEKMRQHNKFIASCLSKEL